MSTTGSSVADKLIEPVTAAAVAGYIQATGTLTPTKVALYVVGGAAVAGIIGFGICYFLSTQGYFPAVPVASEKKSSEHITAEIPVEKL